MLVSGWRAPNHWAPLISPIKQFSVPRTPISCITALAAGDGTAHNCLSVAFYSYTGLLLARWTSVVVVVFSNLDFYVN